jgi:hypothetical protein
LSEQNVQIINQQNALREEYNRRFWERKLDCYINLCRAAAVVATSNPKDNNFKPRKVEVVEMAIGELQVLSSVDVDSRFRDFLETLDMHEQNIPTTPQVYGALFRLASACTQDSAKQAPLDPRQSDDAQKSKVMKQLWEEYAKPSRVNPPLLLALMG